MISKDSCRGLYYASISLGWVTWLANVRKWTIFSVQSHSLKCIFQHGNIFDLFFLRCAKVSWNERKTDIYMLCIEKYFLYDSDIYNFQIELFLNLKWLPVTL